MPNINLILTNGVPVHTVANINHRGDGHQQVDQLLWLRERGMHPRLSSFTPHVVLDCHAWIFEITTVLIEFTTVLIKF